MIERNTIYKILSALLALMIIALSFYIQKHNIAEQSGDNLNESKTNAPAQFSTEAQKPSPLQKSPIVSPAFPDSIDANSFNLEIKPGGHKTDYLSAYNPSSKNITLQLSAVDSIMLASGDLAFKYSEEKQNEIGKYLEFQDHEIALAPNQKINIPFTINLPEHLSDQQKLVGGITWQTSNDEKTQIKSRVIIRVHVLVNQNHITQANDDQKPN